MTFVSIQFMVLAHPFLCLLMKKEKTKYLSSPRNRVKTRATLAFRYIFSLGVLLTIVSTLNGNQ